MWGNIFTEAVVQNNYHIGFSNIQSDMLVHLSQWQYWWWFWFSFLWCFYYLAVMRVSRYRTLKFRPRIATTLKPHGKWGDLLIGVIPVSWCANILSNSNFLLRMIEWQNEGGLFTIRIRGKQWYWVYKFEVKTFIDILTAPKNIGRNRWCIYTPGDMQTSNDYIHIIQLRLQNRWIKKYWNKYFATENREDNFHLASAEEKLRVFFLDHAHMARTRELRDQNTFWLENVVNRLPRPTDEELAKGRGVKTWKSVWKHFHKVIRDIEQRRPSRLIPDAMTHPVFNWEFHTMSRKRRNILAVNARIPRVMDIVQTSTGLQAYIPKGLDYYTSFDSIYTVFQKRHQKNWNSTSLTDLQNYWMKWPAYNALHGNLFNFSALFNTQTYTFNREHQVELTNVFDDQLSKWWLEDVNNRYRSMYYKYQDYNQINRWTKKHVGVHYPLRVLKPLLSDTETDLLALRFMDNESSVQPKILPHNSYLVLKQKRYLRKKVILPRIRYQRDEFGVVDKNKKIRFSGKLHLHDKTFSYYDFNATAHYKRFKKQKVRDEVTSVLLSRRLLRTRRTLVLPAHTNLTLITNSFDVIHSWFVPGLGLKLDCVPGRSTHHTFYIDNVGFYYGQCAEICGRYHHHMPIRICALPFEHFLIWWHTFGLPRLMTNRRLKRYTKYYSARKYVW